MNLHMVWAQRFLVLTPKVPLDASDIFDYINNIQNELNRFGFTLLSRAGGGTSPMIPGNRHEFASANTCTVLNLAEGCVLKLRIISER